MHLPTPRSQPTHRQTHSQRTDNARQSCTAIEGQEGDRQSSSPRRPICFPLLSSSFFKEFSFFLPRRPLLFSLCRLFPSVSTLVRARPCRLSVSTLLFYVLFSRFSFVREEHTPAGEKKLGQPKVKSRSVKKSLIPFWTAPSSLRAAPTLREKNTLCTSNKPPPCCRCSALPLLARVFVSRLRVCWNEQPPERRLNATKAAQWQHIAQQPRQRAARTAVVKARVQAEHS
jgi:hypothetical protein